MPTRNVNLTPELDAAIKARVESGRYENASEVVRAALRALDNEDARQEAELDALRAYAKATFDAFDRGEGTRMTAQEIMATVDGKRKCRVPE